MRGRLGTHAYHVAGPQPVSVFLRVPLIASLFLTGQYRCWPDEAFSRASADNHLVRSGVQSMFYCIRATSSISTISRATTQTNNYDIDEDLLII